MATLCHRLTTLYESGVPMVRALKAIEESSESYALKTAAQALGGSVAQGATFSQAVDGHRKIFTPLFIHMTAIAEQSGTFSTILPQLTQYYEDLHGLYRAVVRQVAYPASVVVAIVVAIPILTAFLSDVAGTSTTSVETQVLGVLQQVGLRVGGTLLLVVLVTRITFHMVSRESILMHCWPLSGIVRRILFARFFWAMMVFTRVGLPLNQAMKHAGYVTGAARIARDFEKVAPLTEEGHALAEALGHSKFLPATAMGYVRTGELAGKLDAMFEHLSRNLYAEAIFRLRILVGLIEPVAIISIGMAIIL